MLSIRTQDRMALVPYNNVIEVIVLDDCSNKEVLDKITKLELERQEIINTNSFELIRPKKDYLNEIDNKISNITRNANKKTILELNNYTLGTYKSKERALEVLDEIEKASQENDTIRYEYFNGIQGQLGEYKYKETSVYQMPKE
jgi:hypothetical protein